MGNASSKVQISLKSIWVCIDSGDIGFLNTVGSLKQAKCFMVIDFLLWVYTVSKISFMSVHGIQNLCLHSRIIHKTNLCLHDTHQKIAVVYTISRPIFWNSNIIIQECLFGLSGLEGGFLGLDLSYIVKESRHLLLKRHNGKKTGQATASFSLCSNHSLLSV